MILEVSVILEEYLLEALLTINIAVFTGGFRYLIKRDMEIRQMAKKNQKAINKLMHRFYGISEDDTDEGYLTEAESRFENINEKLDRIVQTQEKMNEETREEHKEVYDSIEKIIEQLSREENIDFDKDEI